MSDHGHDEHGHGSGTTSLDKGTDNGFWIIFFMYALVVITSTGIMWSYDNFINPSLFVLVLATIIFVAGTRKLKPNQIGSFVNLGRFTSKYTKLGGYVWVWPGIEKLLVYEFGMFTIDVEYSDLTLKSLDNAKGKVQLTLQINPSFFPTLFEITEGDTNWEAIKKICSKKLSEAVPAELASATEAVNIKDDHDPEDYEPFEILTGSKFEEATKDPKRRLASKLMRLLTTRHHTGEVADCFGLDLRKVEIPTPEISGKVYEAEKAANASVAEATVATKKAMEFNNFIDEFFVNQRKQRGMAKDEKFEEELFEKLMDMAERQFAMSKGVSVQYVKGLENSNTGARFQVNQKP